MVCYRASERALVIAPRVTACSSFSRPFLLPPPSCSTSSTTESTLFLGYIPSSPSSSPIGSYTHADTLHRAERERGTTPSAAGTRQLIRPSSSTEFIPASAFISAPQRCLARIVRVRRPSALALVRLKSRPGAVPNESILHLCCTSIQARWGSPSLPLSLLESYYQRTTKTARV